MKSPTAARTTTARQPFFKTTSHWSSIYDHSNDVAGLSQTYRGKRPEWSVPRTAYSSKRGAYVTEAEGHFGCYGDKPRDILPSNSTSMPVIRSENVYVFSSHSKT